MTQRSLQVDPLIRSAFLAGKGLTADEICKEVNQSPETIRAALGMYGIKLDPKPFGARIFLVRVLKPDIDRLEPAASKRQIDMVDLLARILAVVARDISIDGLLDDASGGAE